MMTHKNKIIRIIGIWLAIASFLMIAVLGFHGPIAPELNVQMQKIADGPMVWSAVHWTAAASLSLYALTGIVVLTSESHIAEDWESLTAWAVLSIGSLWTMITAIAEATVVTNAAVSGTWQTFESWWTFAEGMGNGFAFFALAVAVIARSEAHNHERVTPKWSSWIAVIAGISSFSGWVLGMWFDMAPGNFLWLISSIIMSVWILWFGIGLMRSQISQKRSDKDEKFLRSVTS